LRAHAEKLRLHRVIGGAGIAGLDVVAALLTHTIEIGVVTEVGASVSFDAVWFGVTPTANWNPERVGER
jgi:hypothetical protein